MFRTLPTCLQARSLCLVKARRHFSVASFNAATVRRETIVQSPTIDDREPVDTSVESQNPVPQDIDISSPNFEIPEEEPTSMPMATRRPDSERLTSAARLARAKANDEPHFKRGHKQVWLPDVQVVFIQTPNLDPRFAKFKVPLNFSKLDLRDFLWHGYQTRALNIRSWVYQRPIEIAEQTATGAQRARWHRKEAIKYMIIEMDEPFIWPKMPENMKDFDPLLFKEMKRKAVLRDGKAGKEKWIEGTDVKKTLREKLRNDAQAMLTGKVKWRPTHEIYSRPRYN